MMNTESRIKRLERRAEQAAGAGKPKSKVLVPPKMTREEWAEFARRKQSGDEHSNKS